MTWFIRKNPLVGISDSPNSLQHPRDPITEPENVFMEPKFLPEEVIIYPNHHLTRWLNPQKLGPRNTMNLTRTKLSPPWSLSKYSLLKTNVDNGIPSQSLTARPWKMVVGRLLSYWEANFSGGYVKLWGGIHHAWVDVFPYWTWGNSSQSC